MTREDLERLIKNVGFESLVRQVCRIAPEGMAEDAVNSAALALLKRSLDGKTDEEMAACLRLAVTRKALDLRRKRRRTQEVQFPDGAFDVAAPEVSKEEGLGLALRINGLLDEVDADAAIPDLTMLLKNAPPLSALTEEGALAVLQAALICALLGSAPEWPSKKELEGESRSFEEVLAEAKGEKKLARRYVAFRKAFLLAPDKQTRYRAWQNFYWLYPMMASRELTAEDRRLGHAWGIALGLLGARLAKYADRPGRSRPAKKAAGAATALTRSGSSLTLVCGSHSPKAVVPSGSQFKLGVAHRRALRRIAAGLAFLALTHLCASPDVLARLQQMTSEDGPPSPPEERASA